MGDSQNARAKLHQVDYFFRNIGPSFIDDANLSDITAVFQLIPRVNTCQKTNVQGEQYVQLLPDRPAYQLAHFHCSRSRSVYDIQLPPAPDPSV